MRQCTICGKSKPLTEFYTRFYRCKPCYKQSKAYNKAKEKVTEYNKTWVQDNQEKITEYRSNFHTKNPNYRKDYFKSRRSKDEMFRIAQNLRNRLGNTIRAKNYTKQNGMTEILGLTWNELEIYLSSRFDNGMSWDNYGEWEIDHIVPLASASTIEEVEALCHYTNLQPLWKSENRTKSNKIV
jgi:hypothetical protein